MVLRDGSCVDENYGSLVCTAKVSVCKESHSVTETCVVLLDSRNALHGVVSLGKPARPHSLMVGGRARAEAVGKVKKTTIK